MLLFCSRAKTSWENEDIVKALIRVGSLYWDHLC